MNKLKKTYNSKCPAITFAIILWSVLSREIVILYQDGNHGIITLFRYSKVIIPFLWELHVYIKLSSNISSNLGAYQLVYYRNIIKLNSQTTITNFKPLKIPLSQTGLFILLLQSSDNFGNWLWLKNWPYMNLVFSWRRRI